MKVLVLALVASLGTASVAAADSSYIALQQELSASALVNLDLVRSAEAGTVTISDLSGNVLGSTSVGAGANVDVKVPLIRVAGSDVMATVTSSTGSVLAEQRIRFE